MPGTLTIARKEFVDHVSDQTFLLCFGVFIVSMVASTYYQLEELRVLTDYVAPTVGFIEKELWKDPDVSEMLQKIIVSQLSTLGVLVAITLSFNSINKERVEGSLKVLLSYPISRSRIILGKLLASLIVVVVVVVAALTISFGIEMYYLSIPPSPAVLLRMASVTIYGIVLLAFFMSLGTAVSLLVRDQTTCLLSLLTVSIILQPDFFAMATVTMGTLIPNSVTYTVDKWLQYYVPANLSWKMPSVLFWLHKDYLRLTPIVAFRAFSDNIFHFQNVYTASYTGPHQIIEIPFDWLLAQNLGLLLAPAVYTTLAVVVCFVVFEKRDLI